MRCVRTYFTVKTFSLIDIRFLEETKSPRKSIALEETCFHVRVTTLEVIFNYHVRVTTLEEMT